MQGWWGAAVAAVAAFTVGGGPGVRSWEEGPCTLARVDRARTSSRECIACHDGSAGPLVAFQMRPGTDGMSHPVSIDYDLAAGSHPGAYVPAAALPREIPLVNGRVECTTCHDGASATPKHVVDEMQLCTACHRL